MLNKIFIMGRLVADPELKQTPNGQSVCNITLAVERDYKTPEGERETDFIDVVVWRSTADFVAKYFTKGRMAIVEGRLQIRKWTDKEGNGRRSAEIVAENVRFGDSKPDGEASGHAASQQSAGVAAAATSTPAQPAQEFAESGDDELPF